MVNDGFPTDRVELTSRQELGQVKPVPREGLDDRLAEYFRKLLQIDSNDSNAEHSVQLLQRAVLDGKAALGVQPRGDVETQRALQLLNEQGL